MTRPGTDVIARASTPPSGTATDTGRWMVAGVTERGPTDQPYLVRNLTEYTSLFGARVSYGLLYDALDTFFHEGGTEALIVRVVGPGAVVATVNLNDATAQPSLQINGLGATAAGPVGIAVEAGSLAGTYNLVVSYGGNVVEESNDLTTPQDAVDWSGSSSYVRVLVLGANAPAVIGNTPLVGGSDDHTSITDTQRTAALNLFGATLGPAQISYPGAITQTMYTALLNHGKNFNRVPLLDGQDTSDNTVLSTGNDTIRATAGLSTDAMGRGGMFAPWVIIPGLTQGTTRVAPPSAAVAGVIARNDQTLNQNVPAAGANGICRWATGVDQTWTDDVRSALNSKGVNVLIMLNGAVTVYGFRTVAPTNDPWLALSNARLRMAIVTDGGSIAQEYVFAQLDGQGQKIADFNGALVGMLMPYYLDNALYGATSDDAFAVATGPSINTPTTLSNNELHAVLSLKMSPFAEWVEVEIVKVGITDSVS